MKPEEGPVSQQEADSEKRRIDSQSAGEDHRSSGSRSLLVWLISSAGAPAMTTDRLGTLLDFLPTALNPSYALVLELLDPGMVFLQLVVLRSLSA